VKKRSLFYTVVGGTTLFVHGRCNYLLTNQQKVSSMCNKTSFTSEGLQRRLRALADERMQTNWATLIECR